MESVDLGDDGGVSVDRYIRAHLLQFIRVLEAVFVNALDDDRRAVRSRERR